MRFILMTWVHTCLLKQSDLCTIQTWCLHLLKEKGKRKLWGSWIANILSIFDCFEKERNNKPCLAISELSMMNDTQINRSSHEHISFRELRCRPLDWIPESLHPVNQTMKTNTRHKTYPLLTRESLLLLFEQNQCRFLCHVNITKFSAVMDVRVLR